MFLGLHSPRQNSQCVESTKQGLQIPVGLRDKEELRQQLWAGRKVLLLPFGFSVGVQGWETDILRSGEAVAIEG